MEEFYNVKTRERVVTLSPDDVIQLHNILSDNYKLLPEMEPVSPAGIKSETLLHSAVSRQLVGSGAFYKYENPFRNCATLIYGLVKNHSFHNGNKRVGFLALIKHLYVNGYVIKPGIRHVEIYELLRRLADNDLSSHAQEYYLNYYKGLGKKTVWDDEADISYLAYWLRNSATSKQSKVKPNKIEINELRSIIENKGCDFEQNKNSIKITWRPNLIQSILGKKIKRFNFNIPAGKYVSFERIEQIRREFNFSFSDGVDNVTFFDGESSLNDEIVSYKKIIYKLART